MKALLLAEKPSVMRDIKAVYEKNVAAIPHDIKFGAFHGHLMELKDPAEYDPAWKKWDIAQLPLLPARFEYKESDPKSCANIMATIKAGNFDCLINACDAGREGEHIFYSFYEAHGLKLPVYRFWASDMTEKTILAALKNLLPSSQFDGLRESAKLRAQLDWLTGMNFSRAAGLKTGVVLRIGRVVTPTLKLIVDREKKIQNFVEEPFYEILGKFKTPGGADFEATYLMPPENKETKLKDKAAANAILAKVTAASPAVVHVVNSKKVTTKAPTLYSIAELQKDGAKYFGYSATKTEAIAQSLYEKKFTTYPRTESRFLPTAMIPELPKHLASLRAVPELDSAVQSVTQQMIDAATSGKAYIDDAKITDHHAIIPTTDKPDFAALSKDEQQIYTLIGKRFLSIFMEPYIVNKTVVVVKVNNDMFFKANGSVEAQKGFTALYKSTAKENILPKVAKGDSLTVVESRIHEGKTSPPSRFNTSTLLDAMMNAGNYVSAEESRRILRESAGLGTAATRKDILAKLEEPGKRQPPMCTVSRGTFTPTEFGISLIDALGDRDICSPQMTADWEGKLRKLEDGSYKQPDLEREIRDYVSDETRDLLANTTADLSRFRNASLGKCPKCGKDIREGKSYFLCEGYKPQATRTDSDCDFIIPKERLGATITAKDVEKLLSGQPTGKKTMKTKSGYTMTQPFCLDSEHHLVPQSVLNRNSDYGAGEQCDAKDVGESVGKCPICGNKVISGSRAYYCVNKSEGNCTWSMSRSICGAQIEKEDIKAILSGKGSRRKEFTFKTGRKGQARIVLKENGGISFDFSA